VLAGVLVGLDVWTKPSVRVSRNATRSFSSVSSNRVCQWSYFRCSGLPAAASSSLLHRSRATLSVDECSRIGVARVVEVDDFLEAQQIAVVHVRLDETGRKALCPRRGLWRFGTCLRRTAGVLPRSDWRGSVVAIQEKTNSLVDEPMPNGLPVKPHSSGKLSAYHGGSCSSAGRDCCR